ncbi:MAG TPA: iron-sulfur cluster assembly accessory protein [Chthonomonadales bacterium]|nr:iron-sulfur cluster assembly accessory protein [Chthonomonadales bacterium]
MTNSEATLAPDALVVTVTPSAALRMGLLPERKGLPDRWVRLGVRGGGCTGLSYVSATETGRRERDLRFEAEGVRGAVDPRSARHLAGATLDHDLRNLMDGGWRWSNPNARRSCACGTSFAPK